MTAIVVVDAQAHTWSSVSDTFLPGFLIQSVSKLPVEVLDPRYAGHCHKPRGSRAAYSCQTDHSALRAAVLSNPNRFAGVSTGTYQRVGAQP